MITTQASEIDERLQRNAVTSKMKDDFSLYLLLSLATQMSEASMPVTASLN